MRRRAALLFCLAVSARAIAQQGDVRSTIHNLSVSGPGDVKSSAETEVCKFCHIPHTAVVPQPLWGHALSNQQYQVPRLQLRGASAPAPQPDGSSRLCLSCHDGTIALADLGQRKSAALMSGIARFNPGQRGFIGLDLSGSHPISFVLSDGTDFGQSSDFGVKPLAVIQSDRQVRLDRNGKMQCTTCHDPHSDQYYQAGRTSHFSVKPTTTEICLVCHEPR